VSVFVGSRCIAHGRGITSSVIHGWPHFRHTTLALVGGAVETLQGHDAVTSRGPAAAGVEHKR